MGIRRGGEGTIELSTGYEAIQDLLGYVDAENCRHPSCLQYCLHCLQCNTVCCALGEPPVLFVLLCLQYSLQCNNLHHTIHCILRAFSLLLSHYLVLLTFSLSLSFSRHYHFLATARLEFSPSLFDPFRFFTYSDFSRLFATFQ